MNDIYRCQTKNYSLKSKSDHRWFIVKAFYDYAIFSQSFFLKTVVLLDIVSVEQQVFIKYYPLSCVWDCLPGVSPASLPIIPLAYSPSPFFNLFLFFILEHSRHTAKKKQQKTINLHKNLSFVNIILG